MQGAIKVLRISEQISFKCSFALSIKQSQFIFTFMDQVQPSFSKTNNYNHFKLEMLGPKKGAENKSMQIIY